MGLTVCVGSFTGGVLGVESSGLLNPSLRDKKRHTRVHKGSQVLSWACKATLEALVLFNTGLCMLLCHGRVSNGV